MVQSKFVQEKQPSSVDLVFLFKHEMIFFQSASVNRGVLLIGAIGQVGKELFCVKKSTLVTFSVPIISLCEVKTSVFIAVILPN